MSGSRDGRLRRERGPREAGPARSERVRLYDEAARAVLGARLCGIDEVGRGPLAGPVVAAAVVFDKGGSVCGAYDSKQLGKKRREEVFACIEAQALGIGVGVVDPDYIDRYNILQATYEAMRRALSALPVIPEAVLVDGAIIPGLAIPQRKLIRGDETSQVIAAASIVAKVTRDRLMEDWDLVYPGYGFAHNSGYGTTEHLEALARRGVTPIHRSSFGPVRQALSLGLEDHDHRARDGRKRTGAIGEGLAVAALTAKGYRLVAQNWRVAAGELDIVMEDGDTLVFVEVRSRRGFTADQPLQEALASVDPEKQARLRRLAEWFMKDRDLKERSSTRIYDGFRFDVVAVVTENENEDQPLVWHCEGAF